MVIVLGAVLLTTGACGLVPSDEHVSKASPAAAQPILATVPVLKDLLVGSSPVPDYMQVFKEQWGTFAVRGGSSPLIDYVEPELFPDLANLRAASDLIVRGRAVDEDRFAIAEVVENRLDVHPADVQLQFVLLPAVAPALLSDPPLQSGQEYLLFLRTYRGSASPQFLNGDRTFRPVGGFQGQWLVRDGLVVQQVDVPVGSLSGQPVASFISAIKSAPDYREPAMALLRQNGWDVRQPHQVRFDRTPGAVVLQEGADRKAKLAASRSVGLDFTPYAGEQLLWLTFRVDERGIDAFVWSVAGQPVGAWLDVGPHRLVFSINQRVAALAAVDQPDLKPTPTPHPNPIQGDIVNLDRHYRLAEAKEMWVKGEKVRGLLLHDPVIRGRIQTALDADIPVEHVPEGQVPENERYTILIIFDYGDHGQVFHYHPDENRVYVHEDGIAFIPPPDFVAAVESAQVAAETAPTPT